MKRLLAFCIALIMLFVFSGCSKDTEGSIITQITPTKRTTASTTEAKVLPVNIFTGENDIAEGDPTRPVGVVVGNNWKSRPQVGIEKADMYIEIETEGGITRFLTVFANVNRLPDKIGPIRSARTPSVKMADYLDLVYCHAGGSTTGKAKIKSVGLDDLDGCVDSTTFWRDSALRNSKGTEYSMMTGKEEVQKAFTSYGYSSESSVSSPFSFGEKAGDGLGNKVDVTFSYYQEDVFEYNADTKLYTKFNYDEENGREHVTASGDSLKITNVIVLFARKSMENSTTCDFDLSSGHGILASGGTSREISYSCSSDSGVKFFEKDGTTPLTVSVGKSYICVVNSAYESDMVLS